MNKIREELAEPFDGLRVETLDKLESVVKKYVLSFSTFLRENYQSDEEMWSFHKLPVGRYQDKKSYNILSIEEIFKIWEDEI